MQAAECVESSLKVGENKQNTDRSQLMNITNRPQTRRRRHVHKMDKRNVCTKRVDSWQTTKWRGIENRDPIRAPSDDATFLPRRKRVQCPVPPPGYQKRGLSRGQRVNRSEETVQWREGRTRGAQVMASAGETPAASGRKRDRRERKRCR